MSKLRREKSLYQRPLTPDFITPPSIYPDTVIEKKLYRMLLNERQKNARLQFTVKKLRAQIRERNAKGKVRRVSEKFKPTHNPNPKEKP